jgi:hypothetical protein
MFIYSGVRMMKQRKDRKPPMLADVLPHFIRDKGWEVQLDLHSIFLDWQGLVGPETAACCRPLKISRGVLWVEVDSSAWLQQLQFQRYHILETLNASLKRSTLHDIKLALPQGRKAKDSQEGPSLRFIPPPAEEVAAFERQLSCIPDEQCREALMRFWYLAHACRKV